MPSLSSSMPFLNRVIDIREATLVCFLEFIRELFFFVGRGGCGFEVHGTRHTMES